MSGTENKQTNQLGIRSEIAKGFYRRPPFALGCETSPFIHQSLFNQAEEHASIYSSRPSIQSFKSTTVNTDWRKHAESLVEKIRLESRIGKLQRQVDDLNSKLASAQAKLVDREKEPIVVPISTLAPEPLEIIGPIHAVIQATEHEYLAEFLEANLGASGETRSEALDGLKDRIVSTFERLAAKSDDRLGPGPLRQKRVLERLIRRL